MAPVPARKVTQSAFAFRPLETKIAPITSCATVPTTISVSAVEILNQIASNVAMRAKPTQTDACTQTFSAGTSRQVVVRIARTDMTPRHDPCQESSSVPGKGGTAVIGRTPSPRRSVALPNAKSTSRVSSDVVSRCRPRVRRSGRGVRRTSGTFRARRVR